MEGFLGFWGFGYILQGISGFLATLETEEQGLGIRE